MLFAPAGTQVLDLQSERAMGGVPTVKGFATIDHVCLINIEGTGMVGVPGEDKQLGATPLGVGLAGCMREGLEGKATTNLTPELILRGRHPCRCLFAS